MGGGHVLRDRVEECDPQISPIAQILGFLGRGCWFVGWRIAGECVMGLVLCWFFRVWCFLWRVGSSTLWSSGQRVGSDLWVVAGSGTLCPSGQGVMPDFGTVTGGAHFAALPSKCGTGLGALWVGAV